MLTRLHPNIKAIIKFLEILKIDINATTIKKVMQSHPDWPSILAVSDSLSQWQIPNTAGRINPNEIDKLPLPFIAYIDDFDNALEVVTDVTDDKVYKFCKDYKTKNCESKRDFFERWKGIYIIAEKDKDSGEKDYKKNKLNYLFKKIVPYSLFFLLLLLSVFQLKYNQILYVENFSSAAFYIQCLIFLLGAITSALLLWHEIAGNNFILQKVCSGLVKGNCDAVLSSKYSRLFSWLSWSEIGFFYFTGGLLAMMFLVPISQSISIIGYLNIFALPYIIYSVVYQKIVIKQWCTLCLAVQLLLLIGAINIGINNLLLPINQLSINCIIICISIYLIPVLFWFTIKPYLIKLHDFDFLQISYSRLKFRPEVFSSLLYAQRPLNISTNGIGITLGDATAGNILVKVCNPYCVPCSRAHVKIDELLKKVPNLQVKIIFTTPDDSQHPSFAPTAHLMELASQSTNNQDLHNYLDYWYTAKEKKYEAFASKYPISTPLTCII